MLVDLENRSHRSTKNLLRENRWIYFREQSTAKGWRICNFYSHPEAVWIISLCTSVFYIVIPVGLLIFKFNAFWSHHLFWNSCISWTQSSYFSGTSFYINVIKISFLPNSGTLAVYLQEQLYSIIHQYIIFENIMYSPATRERISRKTLYRVVYVRHRHPMNSTLQYPASLYLIHRVQLQKTGTQILKVKHFFLNNGTFGIIILQWHPTHSFECDILYLYNIITAMNFKHLTTVPYSDTRRIYVFFIILLVLIIFTLFLPLHNLLTIVQTIHSHVPLATLRPQIAKIKYSELIIGGDYDLSESYFGSVFYHEKVMNHPIPER